MNSLLIPSYAQGFARNAAESAAPNLWRGLVGAWLPFLGPTGATLRDWSGRQNHGTLTNMTPATDWVSGKMGRVLEYAQAVSQYVTAGDLAIVNDALAGDFQVSVWFKSTYAGDTQTLVAKRQSGGGQEGFHILLLATGLIRVTFDFSGAFVLLNQASAAINDGLWHCVVVGRVGSTVSLYVDGRFEASNAGLTGSGSNTGEFAIGRRGAGWGANTDYMDGQIGAVTAHARGPSAAEVARLYADPFGMFRMRRAVLGGRRRPAYIIGGGIAA